VELFKIYFISVRLIDILDIAVVAFLMYKLYHTLRRSHALRVVGVLVSIVLMWKVVGWLEFALLKAILDQIIGLGGIALLILFAPEIRKFLLNASKNTLLDKIIRRLSEDDIPDSEVKEITAAFRDLTATRNGALVVILGNTPLEEVVSTGDRLDASVSARLLVAIFQKESPLHDGAVLIKGNTILAARCVLPMTDATNLPPELGMRHRAALGISENSDALVLILSEERGEISLVLGGILKRNLGEDEIEAAIDLFLHRN